MDAGSILAYILLILCGAYFASAESAYAKVNKSYLKNAAEEGDRKAKRALAIANDFDRALTTILIGNNIAHLTCSALATVVAARVLRDLPYGTVLSTVVTTVIVFLFSETLPKNFACANSEKVARAFSGSLSFLIRIFRPVAFLFLKISDGISCLFGKGEDERMTEEELDDFIENVIPTDEDAKDGEAEEENGQINEDQADLMQNVVDYTNTALEDVMTMREDIAYVDISYAPEQMLEAVQNSRFSRLLVCDGDLDHVVGVLSVREYLRTYLRRGRVNPRRVMIRPRFASPDEQIDDLCSEMAKSKQQFAVIRENGRTLGIATMEDFLEEVVGVELFDEYDDYDEDFIKMGGNRFRISPKMKVQEAFDRIGYTSAAASEIRKKTVEAWLRAGIGGDPEEEKGFAFERLAVTVGEMEDDTTILHVVIHLCESEEEAKEETEA